MKIRLLKSSKLSPKQKEHIEKVKRTCAFFCAEKLSEVEIYEKDRARNINTYRARNHKFLQKV